MLEIFLIISVLLLILTFFYKQAVCEFRINQIEWEQRDKINTLLSEKIPLVIRNIPSATFWTHQDVALRACYNSVPIFREFSLAQWLDTTNPSTSCPWNYHEAQMIANKSGIAIWSQRWINPIIINPLLKFWMNPSYYCWTGNVGLRKTFATWNCLFPVDGEITVSILPENSQPFLPTNWIGTFPSELTIRDTPFISDLKFIDIILRPGNCLFMPAHWFWSWTTSGDINKPSMACTIAYHTPVSAAAFKLTPYK